MDLPGPEPDDGPDADTEPGVEAATPTPTEAALAPVTEPDLERIAGDLADIEQALDRLSDGSYWTDEITGETIPDEVLAEDPTARRVAYVPGSSAPAPAQPVEPGPVESADAGDPPPDP